MLPYSEASERNKAPILSVLQQAFATSRRVLEVGSGTGQHAVYFAKNLPHLTWLPSDQPEAVHWVRRRMEAEAPENIDPPVALDVATRPWALSVDSMFTANTFHIMSWQEVVHFFDGVAEVLEENGVVCVYGPFRYAGGYTSESNARFDRSLRDQAPHMGLRDFEAVNQLAEGAGLELVADHSMPANNQTLVWQRVRA